MERLVQDARFAARVLWKDRGFATTAVLTLALCVGANAAIFAIVNSVLLQPLPVPHAEQLVYMYNAYPGAGVVFGSSGVTDYYDRLKQTDVFQEQALYNTRGVTLGGEAEPQRITAMIATPSLLRLLQVLPIRGRIFSEEDGELGKTHKAILTYAAWQAWFGGKDSAIGRDIRIGGEPYPVVGVLPQDFSFLDPDVKVWLPVAFTAQERSDDNRHSNNWSYVARLKPGRTVEQARQQIDALNTRNLDIFPALKQILINAGFHTVVQPFQEYLVRDVKSTLYLLWGGVVFVLLVGAVNVTNLMLVRSSARMKELATRHALGAGLRRIARQLLTEAALLALAGGAIGLGLGYAGVRALSSFGVEATPQGTHVAIDATVVAFTFALAVVLAILIGLVPIVGLRHMNLSQAFREEGRSGTAGRGARVVRRALVAAQVAFAFMLLIGAGLLLASFQRVLAVRPGFDASHVVTGIVSPPAARYKEDSQLIAFWNRLAACRTPMIAAVSGFALGGGCELALMCDMIVASETAEFGQPEITLGIIPGGGGTQRLARVIGKQRTMELVLTGRRIDAKEALRFGFVNKVSPKREWLEDAKELARVIARRPPLAVKLAKQAVLAAEETSLTAGLANERRLFELAMATEDRVEGMRAFLDKRRPSFQGR